MKNNVIISLVVSVFINLVGMLINYFSFVKLSDVFHQDAGRGMHE